MIETLERVIAEPPGKPVPSGAAEFRAAARRIATDPRAWTPDAASFVTDLFDGMAATWDAERATNRLDALIDALARGGRMPSGVCLEIGSGTGRHTPLLAETFGRVVAVDLSWQMLLHAPRTPGVRVQADAARLPLASRSAAAVVCVDVLLFPREVDRVLRDDGVLLWINQLGDDGPLFLDTPTVIEAMGGGWTAAESVAGWGSWAVLRR